jgi:hypothetical protein
MPFFRRRPRPTEARPQPHTDGSSTATTVSEDSPDAASGQGALRAPSPLHAFNRFELKYLVPEAQVPEVREHLCRRMDADEHARHGGYDVISLYYDTTGLLFYWEKIRGPAVPPEAAHPPLR